MPTKGKFVPVMLTPFHENGTVDYDGVTALTEYYIESGAGGLFANCLSSEMYDLSHEERIRVTQQVVKAAAGAVPVFSTGTFGGSVESQAGFIKQVYETGATAVVLISSVLASEKETDSILTDRVFELFRQTTGIPFGFYECPVPYKRIIPASQLKEFVATGRVIYYKDTSLSIAGIKEKLIVTKSYPFELYDAYMVNALASLRAGCAGLSCIQGNFIPELITWVCNNFADAGLQEELNLAQQFLTDNMEVMHDTYPTVAKYFLQKRGFPINLKTRQPSMSLPVEKRKAIDSLFEKYQVLQTRIGISQNSIA